MKDVELTADQIEKLKKLWFIYGNDGPKHSHFNHRYIQNFIEHGEDSQWFYSEDALDASPPEKRDELRLTDECIQKVNEIVYGSSTGTATT